MMGSSVFGNMHSEHIQCNAAGGNGGEDNPREEQPIDYTVGCTVPIAVSSPLCSHRRLQTERARTKKKTQMGL